MSEPGLGSARYASTFTEGPSEESSTAMHSQMAAALKEIERAATEKALYLQAPDPFPHVEFQSAIESGHFLSSPLQRAKPQNTVESRVHSNASSGNNEGSPNDPTHSLPHSMRAHLIRRCGGPSKRASPLPFCVCEYINCLVKFFRRRRATRRRRRGSRRSSAFARVLKYLLRRRRRRRRRQKLRKPEQHRCCVVVVVAAPVTGH